MTTPEQNPDEFLARYSKVKLQCRVDRHRWGRKVSYEQMTPTFARRYVMCTECGTQRWVEVNIKIFEWTGRAGYNYAAGYLAAGLGLTRDDFRERLFREDYDAAIKAGRIEYRETAEDSDDEPAAVTPIRKAKKAG